MEKIAPWLSDSLAGSCLASCNFQLPTLRLCLSFLLLLCHSHRALRFVTILLLPLSILLLRFLFIYFIFYVSLLLLLRLIISSFNWQWKLKQESRSLPSSHSWGRRIGGTNRSMGFNNAHSNSRNGNGITAFCFNPAQDPIVKEALKVVFFSPINHLYSLTLSL